MWRALQVGTKEARCAMYRMRSGRLFSSRQVITAICTVCSTPGDPNLCTTSSLQYVLPPPRLATPNCALNPLLQLAELPPFIMLY